MARYLPKKSLSNICSYKLNETYDTLYELQHRLAISDEYLLNTSRDPNQIADGQLENLRKLLEASKTTRENLITWYYKNTLVELNVTISLLTAKIKFMEYKFGLCDGLDLHQACSLSLIDFCNILADKTMHTHVSNRRKTMHDVSNEVNVPIWLSAYRNQICHVPSESPCIAILVPLVVKSLEYLRDSFWAEVLEQETLDSDHCLKLIKKISSLTNLSSRNQHLELRKGLNLGRKSLQLAMGDTIRGKKTCLALRRQLSKNPDPVISLIIQFISRYEPGSKTKHCGLLIEQVILANCFERFAQKLVKVALERADGTVILWLERVLFIACWDREHRLTVLKKGLNMMDINLSVKIMRRTMIPPLKCCHMVYCLIKLDHPIVCKIVKRFRHKLNSILGSKRTQVLIRLVSCAHQQANE